MRFITITLIVHARDPLTGEQKSTRERFRKVLGTARLAEELGFDGSGVGERHERPFISSAPAVVLSHVAALTKRIRLFTAVTTLSLSIPSARSRTTVMRLHADAGGLTDAQHRASLELFQSDIAPVLRREIPDPPWGWGGGPIGDDTVPARAVATTGSAAG
jgi:hypothetical protein